MFSTQKRRQRLLISLWFGNPAITIRNISRGVLAAVALSTSSGRLKVLAISVMLEWTITAENYFLFSRKTVTNH